MNIETSPHNSRILISSGYLLNDANNDINNQEYNFDRIDEFNIIMIADKMDMTYEYYFRHNMNAVERNLNMIIAKNPHLINSLNRSRHHPLIRDYSLLANDYDNI